MPSLPVMGDGVLAAQCNPTRSANAEISSTTRVWIRGSRTTPPFPTSGPASLELRLDQHDDIGARVQQRRDDGEDLRHRDEGDVDRHDVDTPEPRREHLGHQGAGVETLEHEHARVVPQPPVELPVSDVDGDHTRGAALEERVR